MKLGHRSIGSSEPPFIVAEMSGNHNQSLERALAIVDAAGRAGAHGFKIQTYTPDTMTLDLKTEGFVIDDPESIWYQRSLYSLYSEAMLPWGWHKPIFDRAKRWGMVAFSTPFDETAVDFLETLDVPCYKVASFEAMDWPLIRYIAQTGKPIIMSTGMMTLQEIMESCFEVKRSGCKDLVLLKCTSAYPADAQEANLSTIPYMRTLLDCEVGLSDHTYGIGVAVAGVALGASVVEKHFTLSRDDGGLDASFSIEPDEMGQLVRETYRAWNAVGTIKFGPTKREEASFMFRRSLYVCEDLKAGQVLTRQNLRSIRPGYGLEPKYLDDVLGKPVKEAVKRGTPMSWELV